MGKKTATATKIKEDPIYQYVVTALGCIHLVQADEYENPLGDGELLVFYMKNEIVASFKNWDHVIRGKEVISS